MNDMNVVILIGNLTRDAELKYTQGGMAISSFSIAVNRSRKQADGQYVDEASFFDINLFGKIAESIQQYLQKGTKVAVQGSLKQERWTDNTGATRSRVVINADNIQLVGGRREEQPQSPYAQQYQQQNRGYQQRQQQPAMYSTPEYNPSTDQFPEEIPF